MEGVTECDSDGEAMAVFLDERDAQLRAQSNTGFKALPSEGSSSPASEQGTIEKEEFGNVASFPEDESHRQARSRAAVTPDRDGMHPQEEDGASSTTDQEDRRRSRNRARPKSLFIYDLALTMGAETGAVISGIVLTSMVGRELGVKSLSEYLLLRRVLTWVLAATMVGLTTGLPRYVAHAFGHRKNEEHGYFLAALLCLIPAALVTGVILILARRHFALWFFGNFRETGLVMALAVLLFGFAIHRAVGGYYRGLLEMKQANLLELCNTVLLPLAVVITQLHRMPIGAMMFTIGVLMTLSSSLFAVPLVLRLHWASSWKKLSPHFRELLSYGVPRIPGEFGSATLMVLGPILAAHYMNIGAISPLLLGLNILMVIGYAAGPLGSMLLSKVSMMLGQNQQEELRTRMRLLVVGILEISVFASLQLVIYADVVVRAWVGRGFDKDMNVIRVIMLAIPFYLFFVALRSTIDAATVKPLNTANVLISLGVYGGLMIAWKVVFPGRSLLIGIAGSLLLSLVLLALLTAHTFRKFFGLGIPWRRLVPSFAVAAVLGAMALVLDHVVAGPVSLLTAALEEALLIAVYVAILAWRRSGWIVYIWNVGICRREDWPVSAARP